jgi:hypothetical protein
MILIIIISMILVIPGSARPPAAAHLGLGKRGRVSLAPSVRKGDSVSYPHAGNSLFFGTTSADLPGWEASGFRPLTP